KEPIDLVFDAPTDRIFTADAHSDSVSVVDAETLRLAATIPVGGYPSGLAYDADARRLYCGNSLGGTMSVIAVDSLETVATGGAGTVRVLGVVDGVEWTEIPVGDGPGGVTVDPHDGRLLVADAGSGTLTMGEDLLSGRPPAPAREAPSPLVGKPLPEFSLVDLHTGELRSSREWAEKRYIVNFFASW